MHHSKCWQRWVQLHTRLIFLPLQNFIQSLTISCLKKQLSSRIIHVAPLPVVTEKGILEDYPIAILQQSDQPWYFPCHKGSNTLEASLKEDAIWENYATFKQRFPTFQPLRTRFILKGEVMMGYC